MSMKHGILSMTSRKYFLVLLLGAVFVSFQNANAQSTWSLDLSPFQPTTTQSLNFEVATPPGVSEPPSQSLAYSIVGPAPSSATVASGNVTLTMGTAGCCADGTVVVGPFATPGTYTASIFPSQSCADNSCTTTFTVVQAPVSTYPNTLSGQYTFYLKGQEKLPQVGNSLVAIAGTFTADGQGHITAGTLDENGGSGVVQLSKLTGVYTLNSTTGIGTVTLQLPAGALSFVAYAESSLQIPTPNASYSGVDAAIVAAGGSLLSGSGRLANAAAIGYNSSGSPTPIDFSLSGESASGEGALSGIASLNLSSQSTQITGQAELIDSGTASFLPSITGTSTTDPTTGRTTATLTGLSQAATHFAVYGGNFSNGTTVFLSLDPHGSAPLLLGTNGMSLASFPIFSY